VRYLCWFSCGSASAVAARLAKVRYGCECEVLYCDTFAYEHSDNLRFFCDVQRWLGENIKVLKSDKYADIFDVFDKTGWLVGPAGARCTVELKKNVRTAYQTVDDVHILGFTADEADRADRFRANNPDLQAVFPLVEDGITKRDCHAIVKAAGIEQPAMYRLGYHNNNCIGCVKGGAGYWNRIRVDFPEAFERMAKQERKMDVAINKKDVRGKTVRVFLDELDPTAGDLSGGPDL